MKTLLLVLLQRFMQQHNVNQSQFWARIYKRLRIQGIDSASLCIHRLADSIAIACRAVTSIRLLFPPDWESIWLLKRFTNTGSDTLASSWRSIRFTLEHLLQKTKFPLSKYCSTVILPFFYKNTISHLKFWCTCILVWKGWQEPTCRTRCSQKRRCSKELQSWKERSSENTNFFHLQIRCNVL